MKLNWSAKSDSLAFAAKAVGEAQERLIGEKVAQAVDTINDAAKDLVIETAVELVGWSWIMAIMIFGSNLLSDLIVLVGLKFRK